MIDHVFLPRAAAQALLPMVRGQYLLLAEKYAGTPFEKDPAYVHAKDLYEAVRAALDQPAMSNDRLAWRYRLRQDLQWQYTERADVAVHPLYEVQRVCAFPEPPETGQPETDENNHRPGTPGTGS